MNTHKFVKQMTHNQIIIRDIFIGIFLCLLIFISTVSLPLLGFFIAIFLPQPVLFFRLKLGKSKGAIIPIVAFLIILLVIQSLSVDVFFYGSLLLIGFLIGNYLEQHISIEKTILKTVLTTIGICILLFIVNTFTNDKSFLIIISDYVTKNIELSFKIYSEIGIDQKQIDSLAKSSDIIANIIVKILPSMLTTMLLFITWLNILLIKKILNKDRVTLSWLGILNHWKAPEYIVWFAILTVSA
jgi:hypothetical protein